MSLCQISADSFASPASEELNAPKFNSPASKTLGTSHPEGVPSDGPAAVRGRNAATHAKCSILKCADKIPFRRGQAIQAGKKGKVNVRRVPRPAAWKLPLEKGLLVGQGVDHAIHQRG